MRYGMYVKTNMAAFPRIYIAAGGGCIVEVSSGEAKGGDRLFSLDNIEVYNVERDSVEADNTESDTAEAYSAEFGNVEAVSTGVGESVLHFALLRQAAGELEKYFAGKLREFTVPIRTEGTDFQRRVWDALCCIPYGETRTYGEIACGIGCPGGARAVGMACNRNPIMLIVPCHRVVGSDGKLVGFAGGLPMKEALLLMERSEAAR